MGNIPDGKSGDLTANKRFWNEKSEENAAWYVSSVGPYEGRDMDSFWHSGLTIWSNLATEIGYVPNARDSVVEIGCGVGRITAAICPAVGKVHAFDISAGMISIARGNVRSGNVEFYETDGFSLRPLPSGCADFVLAYCVFQHLPSINMLQEYLREMVRVAKPGKTIAFTLTPRNWKIYLLPLLRLRRYFIELRKSNGPRGLYQREWTGIRPSVRAVQRCSPIPLRHTTIHGDKWLFWGESSEA